jgi:hypothetical protein
VDELIKKATRRGQTEMIPWMLLFGVMWIYKLPLGSWQSLALLGLAVLLSWALDWYYSRRPLLSQPKP